MRTATSGTEDRYCSTPLQHAPMTNATDYLQMCVCPCNNVHLRDEPDRIVASNYATVADSRSLPRSEGRSISPDWGKQHNLRLFGRHVRIGDYTTTDALTRSARVRLERSAIGSPALADVFRGQGIAGLLPTPSRVGRRPTLGGSLAGNTTIRQLK